ncbi:hypothetical protein CAPTEDRAFT_26081, partial [Capitella teleta]
EMVDLLIEYGAEVNAVDEDLTTPLNCASMKRTESAFMKPLQHRYDFHHNDENKVTAIPDEVMNIEDYGALHEIVDMGVDLNTVNNDGDTALHCTLRYMRDEEAMERIAVMFIEKGADVNAENNERITPLMIASIWGLSGTANVLLSHQADPNAVDDKGNAPLHYVIQNRHIDIVDLLIGFG